MNKPLTALGGAAATGVLVSAVIAVMLVVGMGQMSALSTVADTGQITCGTPNQATPAGLDPDQRTIAATIITVATTMGVNTRGQVIAIAVGLQESGLKNLDHGDRDSLGVFQQRASWGTAQQRMNPAWAAGAFYRALLAVPGWQVMALTVAAQTVQRSAFPDAYGKHEQRAALIVSTVTGTDPCTGPVPVTGWAAPVLPARVSSPFRPPDRPTHNGVDFAAAKGTAVHAAHAGTVVYAGCAPSTGNCDVDGSASVPGCGWYVDIDHGGGVMTRYCHGRARPLVVVGQTVAVGQTIMYSGSSGNSTGPHVHFEVHINGTTASSAVDPIPFLAARAVVIGK